jgi:hypothetical protein
MPRPKKRSPDEVAEDMKEPMGMAEAGALAITAVHEAVGRAAQKIADEGRKLRKRARRTLSSGG